MTIKRMDNVLIVVDDLEAAKAFFIELGLRLEGEQTVEGPEVGRLIGLENVRLFPEASSAENHAFDVTPGRLVTGLITEKGISDASEEALGKLFGR